MCGKNATQTSTTSPNPIAMGAYTGDISRAANVASLPFVPYGGEFTAPVNAQQQLAGGNINQNWNAAQPAIQQGIQYATQAAQPITAASIQGYLDPWTANVIGATEAQFNQQNAIQQMGVTGNAAAQGALGGDRVGVAQAALAGQQQMQEAPVIAGLEQSGYNTALQTALAEQQNLGQAAYSLGNLGVAGQNAALQGAGAQLGYGGLQQQTQQALDTALYNQFLAQQAYPFQVAQWQAGIDTGVGSQMGGTSTTQGPAPNPLNSILGFGALGLGAYNAGLFANRGGRVGGLNLGDVGYLNGGGVHRDAGGRIRGFAFGGMPYASPISYVPGVNLQVGNTMPKAPGSSGQPQQNPIQQANQLLGLGKNVGAFGSRNADVSQNDAIQAGLDSGMDPEDFGPGVLEGFTDAGLARGGRIAGLGHSAYFADGGYVRGYDDGGEVEDAPSWAGTVGTAWEQSPVYGQPNVGGGGGDTFDDRSSAAIPSTPSPGLVPSQPTGPVAGLGAAAYSPPVTGVTASPASQIFNGNLYGDSSADFGPRQANPVQASPVAVASRGDALSYGAGPVSIDRARRAIGTFESGNNYQAVGPQTHLGRALGRYQVMESELPGQLKQAGLPPMSPQEFLHNPDAQDRVFETVFGGLMDKYGNFNDAASVWFSGKPVAQAGNARDVLGTTVPMYLANTNAILARESGDAGAGSGSGSLMSFAPTVGGSSPAVAVDSQGRQAGFGALFSGHNPALGQALMAAGLGMMASRSPYLGNAIGEGGLAGISAYTGAKKEEFNEDKALKQLQQHADETAAKLNLSTKQAENLEKYRQDQLSLARERLEQGKFTMVPGLGQGPNGEQVQGAYRIDSKTGQSVFVPGVVLQKAGSGSGTAFSDDTINMMAQAIRAGNTQVLTNLGAGAMKAENVAKVWNRVAEMTAAEGGTGGDLAAARANFNAQMGAAKSQAVREANVAANIAEAQRTFPLAIEASDRLPRSQFVPWNRVVQMVQSGTSSPELAQFHTAVQGVITAYSQAMARAGVATVDSRHAAESLLNTAQGPEAFKAVLGQMSKEMQAARAAPEEVRNEILSRISGRPTVTAAPPAAGGDAGGDPLSQARDAIARGAPRGAVIQRLRERGIDPTGL